MSRGGGAGNRVGPGSDAAAGKDGDARILSFTGRSGKPYVERMSCRRAALALKKTHGIGMTGSTGGVIAQMVDIKPVKVEKPEKIIGFRGQMGHRGGIQMPNAECRIENVVPSDAFGIRHLAFANRFLPV